MKLQLDMQHHLLHVYTKFETDISKHVEKSPENLEKSKTRKNNCQNSKNNIFTKKLNLCQEVYSRPPMYQIWRIYLDLWGHDCNRPSHS